MTSALETEHAMTKARWRCVLCATEGIGGLKSWGGHYLTAHYEELPRAAGQR